MPNKIQSPNESNVRRLWCLGEISGAHHALEGSPVAPGTEETLNALRDVDRRPRLPRDPIPDEIRAVASANPLESDKDEFLHNLRTPRRGAAGGPSGMRNEHLRPLLDNAEDCTKFFEISQAFTQAKLPEEIVSALRVGQMTALQKPNGGIRGIVVGDVIRRLVAKTLAKQFMTRFEDATKPFQCALSTRAGCESIAHVVQVMTDRDPNCTVLSNRWSGSFRFGVQEGHDDSSAQHGSGGEAHSISPPVFTDTPQHICGKTRRAQSTKSSKVKAGRATR